MEKQLNNPKLIIDERMRKIEKEKLKELGYYLVEIKASLNVYEEISAHADIFTCKINDKLIVEPSKYKEIKEQIGNNYEIIQGEENVENKYPFDIKYNVCTIGKKALHNFEYTDGEIKKELLKQGYELINTTQGYTNCSIAVIDDNSAIVTDKGLYKILQKHNIDVLYIDYELDIKLLLNGKYSSRNGFIGGTISRIDDYIIISGDLDKIDIEGKIREFIQKRNLKIIEFKNLDVIDYGGIVLLK